MGAGKDLWDEFERLYIKKDWDGAASLFAADAVHVDPTGRHEGRPAIRAWCEEGGGAFSDMSFPPSLVLEVGDTVVVEYLFRATHTGPLTLPDRVIPATGIASELPCVTIFEIRDGKFVNMRDYFDIMTGMGQIGALPST
jgi:ketosteroid isomerase-like protein